MRNLGRATGADEDGSHRGEYQHSVIVVLHARADNNAFPSLGGAGDPHTFGKLDARPSVAPAHLAIDDFLQLRDFDFQVGDLGRLQEHARTVDLGEETALGEKEFSCSFDVRRDRDAEQLCDLEHFDVIRRKEELFREHPLRVSSECILVESSQLPP